MLGIALSLALAAQPFPAELMGPPAPAPASFPSQPFLRGMSFAHVHAPGFGYGSTLAKKEMVKLRGLGVEWISISPFAYQPKVDQPELLYGNETRHGDPTLTDQQLIQAIADAHALGIKVMLKPHIWSSEFWSGGKWHGDIKMKNAADADAWFERYTGYIVHMAALAARAHADALTVGVEYIQMTKPEHTSAWRQVITAARLAYSGPITYCAHHGDEAFQIRFWDSLDWIGLNSYFSLGGELEAKDVPQEAINAAFATQLERFRPLSNRYKKPLMLTELGYPSHAGAFAEPWKSDGARPTDETIQARGYEAALSAVAGAPWVRGVFFWKWFTGGRVNPFERDPYQPDGKEAEQVLKRWYSAGSPLRAK